MNLMLRTVSCILYNDLGIKVFKKYIKQLFDARLKSTGSIRINAPNIIASYAPWENFIPLDVAALCSTFHAVFVQVVVKTRLTCNMYSRRTRIFCKIVLQYAEEFKGNSSFVQRTI